MILLEIDEEEIFMSIQVKCQIVKIELFRSAIDTLQELFEVNCIIEMASNGFAI